MDQKSSLVNNQLTFSSRVIGNQKQENVLSNAVPLEELEDDSLQESSLDSVVEVLENATSKNTESMS